MQGSLIKVLLLALLLVAVPVMGLVLIDATSSLARTRPARTTKRLVAQVEQAKAQVMKESAGGKLDMERYLARLQKIDPSSTPNYVQKAFSNYVVGVERSVEAGSDGTNMPMKDWEWEQGEVVFREAAGRVMKRRR